MPEAAEPLPSALDLNALLAAVEGAPPVAAAEVIGTALAEALDAHDVSFLIADFSGRSLARLSHTVRAGNGGTLGRERTEAVPMSGSPHGRALREQDIAVRTDEGNVLVYAPVSSRGEAIGVLELRLGYEPDEVALASIAGAAQAASPGSRDPGVVSPPTPVRVTAAPLHASSAALTVDAARPVSPVLVTVSVYATLSRACAVAGPVLWSRWL